MPITTHGDIEALSDDTLAACAVYAIGDHSPPAGMTWRSNRADNWWNRLLRWFVSPYEPGPYPYRVYCNLSESSEDGFGQFFESLADHAAGKKNLTRESGETDRDLLVRVLCYILDEESET